MALLQIFKSTSRRNLARYAFGNNARSFPVKTNLVCSQRFSTVTADKIDNVLDDHYEALSFAYKNMDNFVRTPAAIGLEMSIDDAVIAINDDETFDQILILINNAEGKHALFEEKWEKAGGIVEEANFHADYPKDPHLSPRGFGQALDSGRKTAKYFNEKNGLRPDMFVVSPLRRAAMTALYSFPQHAPGMMHERPWICHPECKEEANGKASDFVSNPDDLKNLFYGVDYNLLEKNYDLEAMNSFETKPIVEAKTDLIHRTDNFLEWLKQRDERVIAVASNSNWFQSFLGFTIDCHPKVSDRESFREGELRAIGIKYQ